MNGITSVPNFMKFYQAVQKLLVEDTHTHTDWWFDKPTFIFWKYVNETDSCILFTSYSLQITGKKLIKMVKIMTDYGKCETYLTWSTMFKQSITVSLNICLKTKLLFPSSITFQRKHIRFGIKIFKLHNLTGYTYDTKVCLEKGRQYTTQDVIAIQVLQWHISWEG
jgi:hypothetical protein